MSKKSRIELPPSEIRGDYLPPRPKPDFDPSDWVDRALRGGLCFAIDRDGKIWRWESVPELDPGRSETYLQLCNELDQHRHRIRDEIRRRAAEQGVTDYLARNPTVRSWVFLSGTPCFGGSSGF